MWSLKLDLRRMQRRTPWWHTKLLRVGPHHPIRLGLVLNFSTLLTVLTISPIRRKAPKKKSKRIPRVSSEMGSKDDLCAYISVCNW
ncbi:hypothetical protein SORBI_3004G192450 [Sorghum bicolor]|uniref:Uncharacterized protein n=1 Tax=Sorghum bicolor TaxID=4558 RepID=A0A1Z5RNF1_SORBI|nr:hypothetical protein SORBI_3004G192450 [Sorghum bicolor]